MDIKSELSQFFRGDVVDDKKNKKLYSHDTSIFEIEPDLIVFPKGVEDVKNLVRFVSDNKKISPHLSITARSGGTDMSGGAINDSIIVVFERYFKRVGSIHGNQINVEPGVYYRDFEVETLKHNLLLPSYPASKNICALGGMIANNAGGEKSLAYGKTEDYVTGLKVVLANGQEYHLKPLNKSELQAKLRQDDFEGKIYHKIYKLVDENYNAIKAAKPKVAKNSTGYNLWDIWNKEDEIFDLTKLLVGSQGTLGLVTDISLKLVESQPLSGLLVIYLPNINNLAEIINTVTPLKPTSFETFDDHTLSLAIKFFPKFRKVLGWKKFISLALSFIPDLFMLIHGLPKQVMLVEFEGDDASTIKQKLDNLREKLKPFHLSMHEAESKRKSEKYWLIRRESFNLLRKNVKNKHTVPFIDDLVVPTQNLPEFFPKLQKILEKYDLLYTIAGHMGEGNFHIIPLMDLTKKFEREKIPKCMKEVDELIIKYGGSLSGEHNDGLIRGPFLDHMYDKKIIDLFKQTKQIFDPENIFNPHKKIDADWDYSFEHMRDHF
ncbi:MAG: FAD-binding oxidoreductase [bacterium]|nr:FAD-binding oxidoreductase [bacterium]